MNMESNLNRCSCKFYVFTALIVFLYRNSISNTLDISHCLLLHEDISYLKQDCKDISGLRCMREPCAFGLSRHLGLLRARQLRKRSFFKGRVRRFFYIYIFYIYKKKKNFTKKKIVSVCTEKRRNPSCSLAVEYLCIYIYVYI